MQKIIIAMLCVAPAIAMARGNFERYAPTAQTYRVEGKDASAAEATLAYAQGKSVELCKAPSKSVAQAKIVIDGKTIDGTKLLVCKPVVGKETKTGLALKVKS